MGRYKKPAIWQLLGSGDGTLVMEENVRPTRIAILEDDDATRDYLSELLEQTPGFEIAFACDTLAEAKAALKSNSADVALVDIKLPDGVGLDFIRPFVTKTGGRALILTVLGDRASVLLAFEFGASGYLLKDTPPEQIVRDIQALVDGGAPISPQAATHLLALIDNVEKPKPDATENILTARERDVLTLFSRGLSYKETAAALGVSAHTINDYVKAIYAKMQVHSRNEAIFEAVQNGWLEL
jgi:DNA-binding NarL/FixJ family response regulator